MVSTQQTKNPTKQKPTGEITHLFGFGQLILQGFHPALQAADHLVLEVMGMFFLLKIKFSGRDCFNIIFIEKKPV